MEQGLGLVKRKFFLSVGKETCIRYTFYLFQLAFLPREISFKVNIFEKRVMLPVISRFWGEHVSLNAVICAILVFKKPKVDKRKFI